MPPGGSPSPSYLDGGEVGDVRASGETGVSSGTANTGGIDGSPDSTDGSADTRTPSRSCVDNATRDLACPGPGACLTEIDPAYVLLQDPLNGSSTGKLVGTPHPEVVPGVVGQGLHPMLNSEGAAVRYPITPKASGTLSFWVKVVAPLEFYRGANIGLVGHELTECDDFFMQIQSGDGLHVSIQSATGGTSFRDIFPSVLSWKPCETHHIVLTWGSDEHPELYLDGVWSTLSGAALPYLSLCNATTSSLLFGAARELYAASYSPGALVFDELLLLSRPLTGIEKSLVAIDDACPCLGPAVGEQWAGQEAYLACAANAVQALAAAGRIDSTQAASLVVRTMQAGCGLPTLR